MGAAIKIKPIYYNRRGLMAPAEKPLEDDIQVVLAFHGARIARNWTSSYLVELQSSY
jgi:hypothetical protein